MPIYEFHCESCKADNEVLVRSSDWKGTRCPSCGSVKLTKKLSVFASSVASEGGAEYCPGNPADCSTARSCGCACAGGSHHH